jgi:hypothetical protein
MTKEENECYLKSGIATLQGTREKSDIRVDDILVDKRGTLFQVISYEETDDIYEPEHVRLFYLKYANSEEKYSTILMERSYYPNVYNENLRLIYR